MENEGKILEAIGRQREDIIAHMDKQFSSVKDNLTAVRDDLTAVKSDLGIVKSELGTVKTAVLENSKDVKKVKEQLDMAVTNHEHRIQKLEAKTGV